MENVFDWMDRQGFRESPWLVIGKGPSFARRGEFDLSSFRTLGLNDVAREQKVDILHLIDLSVLDRLDADALKNFQVLLMPWYPHEDYRLPLSDKVFHRPSGQNLAWHASRHPLLKQLEGERRLFWYDASSAPACGPGSHPQVRVGTFSAAAAVNLLARAGVRKIRTLGVDGGRAYEKSFSDLERVSLLDAGQVSYDLQFSDIARTIHEQGTDLAPLGVDAPVRIYVGTQPEQMLPTRVLEYSIRRHASLTVEVIPLHEAIAKAGIVYQVPAVPGIRQRTPFSFQRFLIPKLNDYHGRAIYIDSDMQVFRDIRELWLWPFSGADVMAVIPRDDHRQQPQFSVMVIDCAALRWDIQGLLRGLERGDYSYEDMLYRMKVANRVACVLPRVWNELEHYREGETALLHYTDMPTQPWVNADHPLGYLWCGDLLAAVQDGFVATAYVRDHVERGWVRPSLLYQIEHGIRDPLLLPGHVRRRDRREFVPPLYFPGGLRAAAGYGVTGRGGMRMFLFRAYAWLRYLWIASGLQAAARSGKRALRKLMNLFS